MGETLVKSTTLDLTADTRKNNNKRWQEENRKRLTAVSSQAFFQRNEREGKKDKLITSDHSHIESMRTDTRQQVY